MKSLFVASLILLAAAPAAATTTFNFNFSFSRGSDEVLTGTGTFTADDGIASGDTTVFTVTGATGTITPSYLSDPAVYTIDGIFPNFDFDPFIADNTLTETSSGAITPGVIALSFEGGPGALFAHPQDNAAYAFEGTYDIDSFTVTRDSANASPTPEPASWAMLVAGFGVVGASIRRRRTAIAFTA